MAAQCPHASPLTLVASVCATLALAAPARAERATLAPLKDNTIFSESTNRSNGAGNSLFAGNTATPATRRALLAFDVAAAIPAGATITGAMLELHVTRTMAAAQTMTLNRLLADWGEGTSNANNQEGHGALAAAGDATWRFRFFNDRQWTTNGGDFEAVISASKQAGDTGTTVVFGSTPQLVADVQGWLDEPATNFGWIVRGNEGPTMTTKRFASRENSTASLRPKLTVDFQPPAAQPTATATAMIVATDTPAPTSTASPPPTNTGSATPSATVTDSATAAPTNTGTPSPVPTRTRTATAVPSDTAMSTATHTEPPTPTATLPLATVEATLTTTPSATPSLTAPTATPTIAVTPPASPTFTPIHPCNGDCDGDGVISINELITCVNIALGTTPPSVCAACDPSGNGAVEISELIAAVNGALSGCPSPPVPSPV